MAIKIPSAAELGLGRKTPGAIPEGLQRPVQKIPGIGFEVAQAVVQGIGLIVGAQQQAQQQNQIKLEQAATVRTKNEANISMANITGRMTLVTNEIVNADLPPEIARTSFNTEMREIERSFTKGIPDELQDAFRPQLIKAFTRTQSRFSSSVQKNVTNIAIAKGNDAVGLAVKTAAANPGERIPIKNMVSKIIEGMPIDADKKSLLKARSRAKIDGVAASQLLTERDGGLYRTELDTLIKDLKAKDSEGQFINFKDLPPEARTTYIDQAERAKIQDETSKARVLREETKSALSRYKDLSLAGFPIPPEDEARLAALVEGTEFEQTFKDIKAEGSSLEHIATQFQKAPLEFGAARLGIDIPPLEISDPDVMVDQLLARKQIGKVIQGSIGGSFAPILTNEEIKAVGAMMESDMSAAVRLMDGVTGIVGRDVATGIAMQMGNKDSKKASILRAVADGDLLMARDLATGQELISTKALLMPKPLESLEWFWDESGRALFGYPNNGKEAIDAFHAIYAATAQANGVQDGEFNEDIAEVAYRRAVGDVESINGFQTIIQPGIDEADLRNGIRRIRGAFIALQGGVVGMEDAEAARAIRDDGQFYSAGPNIYRVLLDNQLVMTKQVSPETGQNFPLQFDVSGLKERPQTAIDTEDTGIPALLGFGIF